MPGLGVAPETMYRLKCLPLGASCDALQGAVSSQPRNRSDLLAHSVSMARLSLSLHGTGGLAAGTDYSCYIVVTDGGSEVCSAPVSIRTPVSPGAPTNVVVASVTATSITLTWDEGSAGSPAERCVRPHGLRVLAPGAYPTMQPASDC